MQTGIENFSKPFCEKVKNFLIKSVENSSKDFVEKNMKNNCKKFYIKIDKLLQKNIEKKIKNMKFVAKTDLIC